MLCYRPQWAGQVKYSLPLLLTIEFAKRGRFAQFSLKIPVWLRCQDCIVWVDMNQNIIIFRSFISRQMR